MWRRVTDFASTCLHYSPFPTGSNLSSRVYTNWKAPAHVCQHSRTQGPEEVARRYALLFFGFFSAGVFSAGVSGFRADTTIEGIGIMNL